VQSYRLIYENGDNGVYILTVVHGARRLRRSMIGGVGGP
jgi:hypothetical protein